MSSRAPYLSPSFPLPPPRHYLIYINELVLRRAGPRRQRDSTSQSRRAGGWPAAAGVAPHRAPLKAPGAEGRGGGCSPGALRSLIECFPAESRARLGSFLCLFDRVFRLIRSFSAPGTGPSLSGVPARAAPSDGLTLAQAAATEYAGVLKIKCFFGL